MQDVKLIVLTEKQIEDLIRKVISELVTPPKPETGELLTTSEAADRLKCSTKTIINYIEVGKIKTVNVNRGTGKRCRYKILKSDLEAFIKSRRYY